MQIPFLSLKSITDKYSEEINAAVSRVVNSGWYLQGNENKSFEELYHEACDKRLYLRRSKLVKEM